MNIISEPQIKSQKQTRALHERNISQRELFHLVVLLPLREAARIQRALL
jgi:hypothetical protein